jgi:hypothetical protein
MRMRLRTIIIGLVAFAAIGTGTAVAVQLPTVTLPYAKSFKLKAGQTKTFNVPYLDANDYPGPSANCRKCGYSGTIKLLQPSHGNKPSLKLVHIRKKGTTHRGDDFSATIQNSNKSGTGPVTIKITAKTTYEQSY